MDMLSHMTKRGQARRTKIGIVTLVNFVLFFVRAAIAGDLINEIFDGDHYPSSVSYLLIVVTLIQCCVGFSSVTTR